MRRRRRRNGPRRRRTLGLDTFPDAYVLCLRGVLELDEQLVVAVVRAVRDGPGEADGNEIKVEVADSGSPAVTVNAVAQVELV